MAIGKAKAKKITVSVGERCDRQVLGPASRKARFTASLTASLPASFRSRGVATSWA
jgi:conjugal transfer mating pair stabilization protein TraN